MDWAPDFHNMHDGVIKGNIFRVTGPLGGGFTGETGEFHSERPVTQSFDAFFDRRPKNVSRNSRGAGDLRRYRDHYDATVIKIFIIEGGYLYPCFRFKDSSSVWCFGRDNFTGLSILDHT